MKIKKYQIITILEIARDRYGIETIDGLIEDINRKCENDFDTVIEFKMRGEKEDERDRGGINRSADSRAE